MNENIAAPVV